MQTAKRIISVFLCLLLLSGTAAAGTVGASALSEGYLSYEIVNDYAAITKCDKSVSGEITLPSTLGGYSVVVIGYEAFRDCDRITKINLPSTVTTINGYAFSGCSSLQSMPLGSSITLISDFAFFNCSSLQSVSIPSKTFRVGDGAFAGCSALSSISVASGNTYFRVSGGCLIEKSSKRVIAASSGSTIPSGSDVETIGDFAFFGCTGFHGSTVPSNITAIGSYAFASCTGITNFNIPAGVTSLGSKAFSDCTGLTALKVSSGNPVYFSESNCVIHRETKTVVAGCATSVIPSGDDVTALGAGAFYGCPGLEHIVVPDNIVKIGNEAFQYCTGLVTAFIGKNVTSIGTGVFAFCDSLENIYVDDLNSAYRDENNCLIKKSGGVIVSGCKASVIPETQTLTALSDYAFYGCNGISGITVPSNIKTIGKSAFSECDALQSVTMLGVENVGDKAFYDCDALTQINLPDTAQIIGDSAFEKCEALAAVVLPDSIADMGNSTFAGCTALADVTLPAEIMHLGNYVFSGCESLNGMVLPESLAGIGNYAFENCPSLSSITVPQGVQSIGEAAFEGCALREISLPSSLKTLSSGAFRNCARLKKANIPAGIKSIGTGTFSGCSSLDEITLPQSLTMVNANAFSGCSALTDVYYYGTESDKEGIRFTQGNDSLVNASWHFVEVPVLYTLSYNANGGSGGPGNQTGNGEISISASKPSRSGYSFLGWSQDENATEPQYQPGDSFNLTGNTVLYAVWQKAFVLTYNANGGKNAPGQQTGNGEITLSSAVPSRTDYTFLGWAVYQGATEPKYQPGDSFSLTANTTVYAVWKKNGGTEVVYTLKYDAAGGKNAPASQTGFGTVILSDKMPVRNGYVFAGWAIEKGSQTVRYRPGNRYYLKENSTIYAVWKISPDIKFNVPGDANVAFRTNTTVTVTAKKLPDDCRIVIYENGKEVSRSKNNSSLSYKMGELTSTKTLDVKVVDGNNKVLADSSGRPFEKTVKITVNTGIISRIIAFFRSLFGTPQPTRELKPE